MRWEPQIGPDGRADPVTRALRALHAAPADQAYWDALEARILSRIAAEDAWPLPLRHWVRIGLVAAGVAAVALGAALYRTREVEARIAYDRVIETPGAFPQQIVTNAAGMPPREATLRYVISP